MQRWREKPVWRPRNGSDGERRRQRGEASGHPRVYARTCGQRPARAHARGRRACVCVVGGYLQIRGTSQGNSRQVGSCNGCKGAWLESSGACNAVRGACRTGIGDRIEGDEMCSRGGIGGGGSGSGCCRPGEVKLGRLRGLTAPVQRPPAQPCRLLCGGGALQGGRYAAGARGRPPSRGWLGGVPRAAPF